MANFAALPLLFQSRIWNYFSIRIFCTKHPPNPKVKMCVLSVSQRFLPLRAFAKQDPITRKLLIQSIQRKVGWKWLWRRWSFLAFSMQLVPWFCSYLLNQWSKRAALVPKLKPLKGGMGWQTQLMLWICWKEAKIYQRHKKTLRMEESANSHTLIPLSDFLEHIYDNCYSCHLLVIWSNADRFLSVHPRMRNGPKCYW